MTASTSLLVVVHDVDVQRHRVPEMAVNRNRLWNPAGTGA